jgi:soluble lytic murein transglycosylase-like protein
MAFLWLLVLLRAEGQLNEFILRVKGMKKYSHLFLFVVLLNATSNAQIAQPGAQSAAVASQNLGTTAATALQGIGAAIAPIAKIAAPVIPAPSIVAPLVKMEATTTPAPRETQKAAPASVVRAPIAGRGVRSSANLSLKGQTTGDPNIDAMIISAATNHEVEPLLLYSVMTQESAYKIRATSNKGACGLMQLMPATAARFGVKDIFDPEQNIQAGARYLRFLLDLFNGDVSLALAGYNAGEGAVKKYGYTVPPYRETMNYVRKIKRRYVSLTAIPDLASD